jgi:hypothetical protein
MKKILVLLIAFAVTAFFLPSQASAQENDTVNLNIRMIDQNSKNGSKLTVSIIKDASKEDKEQKNLNESLKATFGDMSLEQFTLQVTREGASYEEIPQMEISLFSGSKTAILNNQDGSADISVAEDANELSLGLILTNVGQLKLYNVSEDVAGAFSTLPSSNPAYNPDNMDIKLYFIDKTGASVNSIALAVDAGDKLKSNADGEVYISALAPGTHKLTAYSESGAILAQSYITMDRDASTDLTATNASNPTLTVENGLKTAYIEADIKDSVVNVGKVSAEPLMPGIRPLDIVFALKGCLVDSEQKPLPSVQLSLGDHSATTNTDGFFWLNGLPADKYRITAQDQNGRRIASSTLLIQKDTETGIKDVSLSSATLTIDDKSGTVYMKLQLTDENALMVTAASNTNIFVPAPAAASDEAVPSAPQESLSKSVKSISPFSIYAYLFIIILVLIVLVIYAIVKVSRAAKKQ